MNNEEFFKRLRNRILCAQKYTALGWHVFPVWPPRFDSSESDGKIPAIKGWSEKAYTDPKEIGRRWLSYAWRGRGLRMERGSIMSIGISTGLSGLVVLDEDPRNGGDIMELPLSFKDRLTVTVATPSGGRHVYYRAPEGIQIDNSQGVIAPGIDIRAHGGMVVAPPSLHKSGKFYEFEDDCSVLDCEVLPLPDALLKLVREMGEVSKVRTSRGSDMAPTKAARIVSGNINKGSRHTVLLSLAGTMYRRGMSIESIEKALLEENRLRCKPPMKEKYVSRIAMSLKKYPRGGSQHHLQRKKSPERPSVVDGICLPWERKRR